MQIQAGMGVDHETDSAWARAAATSDRPAVAAAGSTEKRMPSRRVKFTHMSSRA